MTSLGSFTWGERPVITLRVYYEAQRTSAGMQYRFRVDAENQIIPGVDYYYNFNYPVLAYISVNNQSAANGTVVLAQSGRWSNGSWTSNWFNAGNLSGSSTSMSITISTGTSGGDIRADITRSFTLPVYGGSTISGPNSITLGSSGNIVISADSSSYRHKVTVTCGSITEVIRSSIAGGSFSWAPSNDYGTQIGSSLQTTATVTCVTYTDSSMSVAIGTSSFTLTLIVNATTGKPTLSLTHSEVGTVFVSGVERNIKEYFGKYVAYKSRVQIDASLSFKFGATQSNLSISAFGTSYSYYPIYDAIILSASSAKLSGIVTDNRNLVGTQSEIDLSSQVYDYAAPSVSFSVHRAQNASTESDIGQNCITKYTISFQSLGGKNIRSAIIYWKKTSDAYYSETNKIVLNVSTGGTTVNDRITFEGQQFITLNDTENSYIIKYVLQDSFNDEIEIEKSLSSGFVPMDFYRGGTGVAIGEVADSPNTFAVNPDYDVKLPIGTKIMIGLQTLKAYIESLISGSSNAYPVGSYFWTSVNYASSADVNEALGTTGATWQKITGKFLFAADSTHASGTTGGNEDITLQEAQMPSHRHTVGRHNHTVDISHGHTGTVSIDSSGAHVHNVSGQAVGGNPRGFMIRDTGSTSGSGAGQVQSVSSGIGFSVDQDATAAASWSGGSSAHSHTGSVSVDSSGGTKDTSYVPEQAGYATATSYVPAQGTQTPVEIMPPYQAAYCWHRTA